MATKLVKRHFLVCFLGIVLLVLSSPRPALSYEIFEPKGASVSGNEPAAARGTFVVNSTGDGTDWFKGDGICETVSGNGVCTLRAAIDEANWLPDLDVIQFNIPGSGPHTISPRRLFDNAFFIRHPVLIDGFSQPGASPNTNPVGQGLNSILMIVIDGGNDPQTPSGFSIGGSGATLRGVVVQNFQMNGIELWGSNNTVAGCYVGTDANGFSARPNINSGISVGGGIPPTTANTIGGVNPADRNLISGNANTAISIFDSESTLVQGNLIGTTVTGEDPLGNESSGIGIDNSNNNTIGGTDPGAANVIAFNGVAPFFGDGVHISDIGGSATGNRISGNSIHSNVQLGIDLVDQGFLGPTPNDAIDSDAGPNNLQNFPEIISLVASKAGTTITGLLESEPNQAFVVEFFSNRNRDPSGFGEGEEYLGSSVVNTDAVGSANIQFVVNSVVRKVTATATNTATNNTSEFSPSLKGFVVNSTDDVPDILIGDTNCDTGRSIFRGTDVEVECTLRAAIQEGNADVEHKTISFDIPVGNDPECIGGNGCTIKPKTALPTLSAPAKIDGYTQPGSVINTALTGTGLSSVLRIALDGTDAGALAHGLTLGSSDCVVTGLNIRNFSGDGIRVDSPVMLSSPTRNRVIGNYIGTDLSGSSKAANRGDGVSIREGNANTIGGDTPADRNLISGNGTSENNAGILIKEGSSGNTVSGNLIGTAASGTTALPNWGKGVVIEGTGTNSNTISDNLISGNGDANAGVGTTCAFTGILIRDFAAMNTLSDNSIGTSVNGANALGNRHSGICVLESGVNNKILGNTISANGVHGIEIRNALDGAPGNNSEDLEIVGNTIGADESGLNELQNNASGVFNNGAPGMLVDENLISGNSSHGIRIEGGAVNNRIIGNKIGTDAFGTVALANGDSGILVLAAENLIIGTSNAGEGNLISGNLDYGLVLRNNTNGTTIRNNRIGTDVTGGLAMPFALPNFFGGILIEDADNTQIGGLLANEGNVISGNNLDGIYIKKVPNANRQRTTIQGNMIGIGLMGVIPNANFSGVSIERVSEIRVERNTIAYNEENGVTIDAPAEKNIITRNSIFQNQMLGIDLGADGVTANDDLDADAGANKLMNTPVIGVTEIDGAGDLIARVTVDAANGNASYPLTVEFFEADLDAEEGKRYLGSATYTAPDARMEKEANLGNAAAIGIAAGNLILASATDDENNTSEFSFVQIVNPPVTGIAFDFGDAPESGPPQGLIPFGYPTTFLNDGARHVFSSFIRLGDHIDDETDGLPTIQVAGDDQDNLDDDDGIVFETGIESNPGFDAIPLFVYGLNEVTALNSVGGVISAWIDLNRDGDWNDAGEQVLTDTTIPSGPDRPILSIVIPESVQPGYTVARFRFSTQSSLAPTGLASNGEVEDYLVRLTGATNTDDGEGAIPQTFSLFQNYPNPFNPITTIRFSLPTPEYIRLVVFDVVGREIMVLTDDVKAAGYHEVRFDAARLPSGVYFYELSAGANRARRKMILNK